MINSLLFAARTPRLYINTAAIQFSAAPQQNAIR